MEDNTGEAIYHLRIYSVSQSMRDTALSKGALLPNDGVNDPKVEMLDEYTGDRGYIGDIVNEKITSGLIVANDGYTMMEHAVMHENSFPVYPPDFSRVEQIINDMPDPTYTIDGGVTNYKALIPGEHSVTLKQLKYKVFSMDWAGIVEVAVVPKITKITCRTLATPTSAGF
ncbi:hypothetical protein FAP59_19000 [Morganella morganii]|nr:hypothetical protein [Morganella morganii]